MNQRFTPATLMLLVAPPLIWAGNAMVGRLAVPIVPPFTLNLLRWSLAFIILLPMAAWVLKPGSGLWSSWRRFAVLGLFGAGLYNTLQYLALKTSTPINVTLVASSIPIWMLGIGALFYGQTISRRQIAGAVLSILGVVVVLCQGDWHRLAQVHLVPGDIFMLLASLAWAIYSWLLTKPAEPQNIRSDWAAFLMAQTVFGIGWSSLFSAGEWAVADVHIEWGWALLAALLYVSAVASVLAYRCWGLSVARVGPNIASFFTNLTPLFAALLSTVMLGEAPRLFHGVAFALIVGGIVASSGRKA
ncbi:DMT family transporter [Variovorax sp. VNK109]|uniref:DMT family transporter n=1 Tax=Variovorax sp. VNK109 TaxID=3400919 RepID=UPI003C07AF67